MPRARAIPGMRRLRSCVGSELIEFAVILPLLLLVVFGVIDFSIALYDKAVVTNASREGARAGIVFAPNRGRLDAREIERWPTYCRDYLITFGTPNLQVTG